jgi:hypothetical protein
MGDSCAESGACGVEHNIDDIWTFAIDEARSDLCGGCRATGIPAAIDSIPRLSGKLSRALGVPRLQVVNQIDKFLFHRGLCHHKWCLVSKKIACQHFLSF